MLSFLYLIRNILLRFFRYKTIGVSALVIKGTEVLIVEHTYKKGWYFPGGGVERDESTILAIRRELFEEVGVELRSEPKLFSVYLNKVDGRDDYVVFYICDDFIEHSHKCSFEIKEKRWCDIAKLPSGMSPSNKRRIEEYIDKSKISDRW